MKKFFTYMYALLLVAALAGCDATGGTETGNPTDSVALAIGTSIDTLSSSVSADPGTLSALTLSSSEVAALRGSNDSSDDDSTSRSCDTDDDIDVSIACDESGHDASITRNFGTGCSAARGVTLTGGYYATWANMGSTACGNSVSRPRLFEAVRGSGAYQTIATGSNASSTCDTLPTSAVTQTYAGGAQMRIRSCRRFDYSGYSSSGGTESFQESMRISQESRVRYRTDGQSLFSHRISTPSPLIFSVSKSSVRILPIKRLNSGVVSVEHLSAGYTVTNTFSNLEYDYEVCRCHPISGSVAISVTDTTTGESIGSGTLTFTETTTGQCNTNTATYNGETVTVTLGACRGF